MKLVFLTAVSVLSLSACNLDEQPKQTEDGKCVIKGKSYDARRLTYERQNQSDIAIWSVLDAQGNEVGREVENKTLVLGWYCQT